jgi:hypothetical protein
MRTTRITSRIHAIIGCTAFSREVFAKKKRNWAIKAPIFMDALIEESKLHK